jgi:hypothetical protein
MGKHLALIEPIKLPDPRRPATLPSLPAWAERLKNGVRLELQMTPDGKTFEKNDVLVLPAELMPNQDQRRAMTEHLESLRCYLLETPAVSVVAETRVATAISKLLMVLAGERKSDLAEEGRSDVYLDVLDDVPCWAVESAVRSWFKHDCGTDERGRPHDYKWAPDPGTLRKIALREVYAIGGRIGTIQRVLDARQYVDCTRQLELGRSALLGLNKVIKSGDLDGAKALSFEDAVKLGNEPAIISTASNEGEKIDMPAEEAAE